MKLNSERLLGRCGVQAPAVAPGDSGAVMGLKNINELLVTCVDFTPL